MLWSQITVPGKLQVLLVDGSCNAQGWEVEFCDRMFNVLRRKNMHLSGAAPLRANRPDDLVESLRNQEAFNCILLFCHGYGVQVPQESKLSSFWAWLSRSEGLTPKMLAVCTWETHDSKTSQSILQAKNSFAQLAITPQSPLTPRAAGLFYMKFFTELDLHSHDSITGKMVWFSHAKARELLKRRQLHGEIGMRC